MAVSGLITKETIRNTLIKNRELLEQYNVIKIGIFGSYVREEPTKNSDIDLLIETKMGMDLMAIVDLEMRLSDILGRKVDLVSAKGLNKYLRPYVMKEVEFIEGF